LRIPVDGYWGKVSAGVRLRWFELNGFGASCGDYVKGLLVALLFGLQGLAALQFLQRAMLKIGQLAAKVARLPGGIRGE
jgi:hypothetical protein